MSVAKWIHVVHTHTPTLNLLSTVSISRVELNATGSENHHYYKSTSV